MFDWAYFQSLWGQFHFIRPLWLGLLVPFWGLVWLRWQQKRFDRETLDLPSHLHQALVIEENGWRKDLPLKGLSVVGVLAITICAGPAWQRMESPFDEDQAALLIVLDTSESMLQQDIAPSRLDRAKQKISDLLAYREGGRTGLIVYSGSAHIAMPLTQDQYVFTPFLAAIEPDVMPIKGKQPTATFPLIEQQLHMEKGATVLFISDRLSSSNYASLNTFFTDKPYQLLMLEVTNESRSSLGDQEFSNGHHVPLSIDMTDIEQLHRYIARNMAQHGDINTPWQDMGYFLLLPLSTIFLVWFRKGWLVQWGMAGIMVVMLGVPMPTMANTLKIEPVEHNLTTPKKPWADSWWSLWFTPDQRGQYWFNQQQYLRAAETYDDPQRKGIAFYYAGEYQAAYLAFIEESSLQSMFYGANALARQREYLAAKKLLQAIKRQPDLDQNLRLAVDHNLLVINSIIDEINRTSESQIGTTDGPEESFELSDDQPRTADGIDEVTMSALMIVDSLNATEILTSEKLADLWLKRVEADPKYFLKAKFQIQLQEQVSAARLNNQKEQ
ncbi:TPA: VWA domain-containing protein [Photobacterium damselae]